MPDTPRVSLGMPVYNGADHLAETLDTILAQTYRDFELIICDNASTDATEAICRDYSNRDSRIRYVRNAQNLGASPNYNKTFELARGVFFKWAAHDDPIDPAYLQACVDAFDANPESVVLVFPQRLLLSYEGEMLGPDPKVGWTEAGPSYDRISFGQLNRVPGLLFPILVFGLIRADALRKTRLIGPYNHADLVLVGELRLVGEFREVPKPLFRTRLHKVTEAFRKERCTYDGEAQWYDTALDRKKLRPEYTLLKERLISVSRAELPFVRRIVCYADVLFGQFVTRFPGWLAGRRRAMGVWCWRVWEKRSIQAVRRAGRWQVPHRLWAMLSAMRRLDLARMALSLSWPTAQNHTKLHVFVRERLQDRVDPQTKNLLTEWDAHAEGSSAKRSEPMRADRNDRMVT